MKPIVMIIDELKGGGAQRSTARLSKLFLDHDFPVSLIILQNTLEVAIDPRAELYYLDFKKGMISYLSYKYFTHKLKLILDEIKKKSGTDPIIIGHLGLAHNLMNRLGLSDAYYTLHGTTSQAKLGNKSGSKKERKIREIQNLYNGKNIISVSDGVGQDILNLGVKPKSIQTIYNPFDFEEIRALANEKIDFDIPKEPYIVHVGRFSKVKRHDILLNAFALLEDKSYKLVLVGKGEEEENIRSLAKNLGISERMVFAGFQENPYPIIKNASVLALTSENEGFSLAIVEALALNVKVVSTDCLYGPREILTPDLIECLVPLNDFKTFAETLKKIIEKNVLISDSLLKPYSFEYIINNYKKINN